MRLALHHPTLPRLLFADGRTLTLLDSSASGDAAHALYTHTITSDAKDPATGDLHTHQCAALSTDGRRLAFTTTLKRVVVVACDADGTWSIEREGTVNKRVSRTAFVGSPKTQDVDDQQPQDVVYADKFGDVYRLESDGTSTLLMGHVSMITDMTFAHADTLLITAERDEKIRLTRYPATHIIEAMLFGHRQFVSSVHVMQSRHRDGGNRLVSGGGDRELFVWDVEVKDANADADGTRHPLSQFDLYAALTASDEVKLPTEQQQRQQLTVRQITSVIQGDVERLLVIVEQVPAVMVLTLNSDDDCLSLERIVKLSACPLDMSVDANGCVWMAVDDCAMPVIRHSFATESGAPLVTSLDASLAHSLASLASASQPADLWLDSTLRKGSFKPDAKAGGKRKRDELRDEEAVDAEA